MALRTLVLTLALALVATVTFASAADEDAGAAAEREMVMDPSTGKMVTAPQYGGDHQSDPARVGELLRDRAFEPVLWLCSRLGGEEDTAAYDARQETPGIWLEEVE